MNNGGSNSFFRLAGYLACAVLILGGIATMVVGMNGRGQVSDNLKAEQIQGTPDMKPDVIKAEATKAGVSTEDLPDCEVAGKDVTNGTTAKCFASYMRVHALMATGGKTFAQMPRFASKDGQGTNEEAEALKDPKSGQPVDNPARNIWTSEVAFSQALNMAYLAEQVGMFSIWMGLALILIGVGLLVTLLGLASRDKPQTA